MNDRLVRTREQAKPQNPKSSQNKPKTDYHYVCYRCKAVNQSMQQAVKCGREGAGTLMIVEPMGAQRRPKGGGGNLLEYPVTVVGVLGLWSFIAGGTLRGAGHGRTHTHKRTRASAHIHTHKTHTIRTPGWEVGEENLRGRKQKRNKEGGR